MKLYDIISEAKRKSKPKAGDTTPHDYTPGWESLNYIKQHAKTVGDSLAGKYQLFVPRSIKIPTPREKASALLKNPYAWDDQGNLKPEYAKNESIQEAAPILAPGKPPMIASFNKPMANLWTSTAYKSKDGKWSSSWNEWVIGNMRQWTSDTGYLYKVKSGALVLELNSDADVEQIYSAFSQLGKVTDKYNNSNYDYKTIMRLSFPWQAIAKHFDAVHHSGYSYGSEFLYGWDAESTAWLDTSFLQLVGEVPVTTDYDDD